MCFLSLLLSVIFLKIDTFSPYASYWFMWLNTCPLEMKLMLQAKQNGPVLFSVNTEKVFYFLHLELGRDKKIYSLGIQMVKELVLSCSCLAVKLGF